MAKATILFAEDDTLLRNIYTKKFTMAGYDVRPAADGEEAIQLLSQLNPDLLVLDISMPKVDGFQVLERFPKEQRKYPVVMLTNFDLEEYRKRGKELGADDFFVKKDMTIRSLLEMVERLLAERKQQK
ncbi:MAG: response regulator [Candidatus Peribacteraceae bacterium]|jgi:DNA-binding response OmpR family regulator